MRLRVFGLEALQLLSKRARAEMEECQSAKRRCERKELALQAKAAVGTVSLCNIHPSATGFHAQAPHTVFVEHGHLGVQENSDATLGVAVCCWLNL